MLALYHMAVGTSAQDLPGLDQLLKEQNLKVPAKINRAVLVGTSRGPPDVLQVERGRKIRTTWGVMAWQLGGAHAIDMTSENAPNDIALESHLLTAHLRKYPPCLTH